mgnify:CR=1 FL=1
MKIKSHDDVMMNMEFDINPKFDAVLIIGNGFDLNFNLKTGYTDFIKSNDFRQIVDKNGLCMHLHQKHNLHKWIDIEKELGAFSINTGIKAEQLRSEFQILSNALVQYLKKIDLTNLNKSNVCYELISEVATFNSLVIDFNYTNTVKVILKEKGVSNSKNLKHVKIHGSLETGNIIFGVDDKMAIRLEHIFLKKSVNKYYNAENFSQYLAECNSIIIFGHSLGETDHMYFQDYFRAACNSKNKLSGKEITIYHLRPV